MTLRALALATFVFAVVWNSVDPAAAQDAAAGAAVFKSQCGICHSVQAGRNMTGPSLFGVVGRPAGKVPGFHYSPREQGLRPDLGRGDARPLPDQSGHGRSAHDHDLCRPEGRAEACRPDRLPRQPALKRRSVARHRGCRVAAQEGTRICPKSEPIRAITACWRRWSCVFFPRSRRPFQSFAQQTGQPCTACHIGAFGPQLTAFGRAFKIGGYTQTGGDAATPIPFSSCCSGLTATRPRGRARRPPTTMARMATSPWTRSASSSRGRHQ